MPKLMTMVTVTAALLIPASVHPLAAQEAAADPAPVQLAKKPKCDPERPRTCVGPRGPKGEKGDTGAPGSARAYGAVDPALTGSNKLVFARSKNVVQVVRSVVYADGAYCVAFDPAAQIDVKKIAPVATLESSANLSISWYDGVGGNGNTGCPAGQQVFFVRNNSSGVFVNDVGFSFLIP